MTTRLTYQAFLAGTAFMGILAACTGSVALGTAPSTNTSDGGRGADANGAGGDGSTRSGPYGITCGIYHRARFDGGYSEANPPPDFEQQTFATRSDASAAKTFTFPDATIDVELAPATDNPSVALLTVHFRELATTHVYRLDKSSTPVEQFVGGHGFTGLVYVADNVQYICSAENAPAMAIQSYIVPLDLVCQVEVRTTPGGRVEQSQLFEFIPKIDGSSPAETKSIATDGVMLDITVADTAFESHRSVNTSVRYGPSTATGSSVTSAVGQLFQLTRNTGVVNQLANTTFTGRISVNTSVFQNGTQKEISYACASRVGGGATVLDPSDAGVLPDGATLNPIGSLKPCGYLNGASSSCGPCDSQEFCFTQVSCGMGGPNDCNVGSSNPADNRCHKSCQTNDQCGADGECVTTLPYFGCSNSDSVGPGRGICCAKGTNCQ